MNFSLRLIYASTIILYSVCGDVFDTCSQINDSKTWCLGLKDNKTLLRKGKGCFLAKDCDALVFAELQSSGDKIKWTVSGHKAGKIEMTFSLTHSPYTRDDGEDTVFNYCAKLGPSTISIVGFIGKDKGKNSLLLKDENSYKASDTRREVIAGKDFIVCEYISKTHIFYKNSALGYDYNVDLVSQMVYPNLLASRLKSTRGHTSKAIPILVYVPPVIGTTDATGAKGNHDEMTSVVFSWLIAGLVVLSVLASIMIILFVVLMVHSPKKGQKSGMKVKMIKDASQSKSTVSGLDT